LRDWEKGRDSRSAIPNRDDFICFINEYAAQLYNYTKLKLFDDDMKLYSVINITASSSDLQQSIHNVLQWANLWQFTVITRRTFVLTSSNGASFGMGSVGLVLLIMSICCSPISSLILKSLWKDDCYSKFTSVTSIQSPCNAVAYSSVAFLVVICLLCENHSLHTLGQLCNIVLVLGGQLIRCKLT
jgi:hypothetical protein